MRFARTLWLPLALVAVPARAERKETPPQVYKAGAVVKLSALSVELTLPSDDEWSVSVAVDGSDAWDILRRADGAFSLELSLARAKSCAAIAESLDALKTKRHDNPGFAPAAYDPWTYEPSPGLFRVCTNTNRGPVTVDLSASVPPATVSAFLAEIARMVGGRRETKALGFVPVAVAGRTLLAVAGVHVDIPKGFSLRQLVGDDGVKRDVLERFEPRDPPLSITFERRVGACPTPSGTRVKAPAYLPPGLAAEAFETEAKGVRTGAFCFTLGPDAIVARITFTNADDARIARGILAPAAADRSGVGSSLSSDEDVDDREIEDDLAPRVRGVLSFDLVGVRPRSADERPFGVGLGFHAWGVTSTPKQRIGYGLELASSAAIGTERLLFFDAHAGIGPSLSLGRFVVFPAVGGGVDAMRGDPLTVHTAPYLHGGGRVFIPFGRRAGLTLGGAYHHRFARESDVPTEARGSAIVTVGSISVGLRVVDYASRGAMGTVVLGFTL